MDYCTSYAYLEYLYRGPTNILCDNKSCVNNASKVESTLNNEHSSLACPTTRWAVAAGTVGIGKIDKNQTLADALSKVLTIAKRNYLFGNWTY